MRPIQLAITLVDINQVVAQIQKYIVMDLLKINLEKGIKVISFNSPKKKNPLTGETMRQLSQALTESESDGTKAIVLKGEGGNFSSGALLDPAMMGGTFDVTSYLKKEVNPVIMQLRTMPIPVIAEVQGVCVGLGFSIALACDMIYAGENAIFSQIFTRIGLSSDGGGAYFLSQTVGARKAFELIATNSNITAKEAFQWGIINHAVADEALEETVMKMANKLVTGPSIAIGCVKHNLQEAAKGDLANALEVEAVNQGACFKSKDFIEGVTAFMEKRKPVFKGE